MKTSPLVRNLSTLILTFFCIVIFVVDHIFPWNFSIHTFYILPVVAYVILLERVRMPVVFLALCTGLIFAEHLTSVVPSEQVSSVFVNKMISLFVLWCGTYLTVLYVRKARSHRGLVSGFQRELENKITERTRELKKKETELRQAQKMEAIGRLAGGVAHDFNNKLGAIMMTCNLLESELKGNQKSIKHIKSILDISTRAADLTRQLLAFGQVQTLNMDTYDVNHLVMDSARMLRALVREDIDFQINLGEDVGNIKVDSTQLGQVLINLVVNARDAMPNGGRLRIETSVHSFREKEAVDRKIVPGAYICLTISDTGCGIDESIEDKIFEPFFTTKEGLDSSGLGLSTVEGIVKQCGGYIWVNSEKGMGTTFRIYFPVAEPEDKQSVSQLTVPSGITNLSDGTVILLVEDEDEIRVATSFMLKNNGFEVLEAINGKEAISKIKDEQRKVDLVITDVIMPEMNGKDFAEEVSKSAPDVPIIFTSGYSDNILSDLQEISNPNIFLQKPVPADSLLTEIYGLLEARRAQVG